MSQAVDVSELPTIDEIVSKHESAEPAPPAEEPTQSQQPVEAQTPAPEEKGEAAPEATPPAEPEQKPEPSASERLNRAMELERAERSQELAFKRREEELKKREQQFSNPDDLVKQRFNEAIRSGDALEMLEQFGVDFNDLTRAVAEAKPYQGGQPQGPSTDEIAQLKQELQEFKQQQLQAAQEREQQQARSVVATAVKENEVLGALGDEVVEAVFQDLKNTYAETGTYSLEASIATVEQQVDQFYRNLFDNQTLRKRYLAEKVEETPGNASPVRNLTKRGTTAPATVQEVDNSGPFHADDRVEWVLQRSANKRT